MEIINKSIVTKTNDVDEQGRVVIAVNAIGNEDADGDISMPGSFNKTLKEDFNRLKWFLNHDPTILLGIMIRPFYSVSRLAEKRKTISCK